MSISTTPLPLADGTDAFVPAVPQKKVTGINYWLLLFAATATAALHCSLPSLASHRQKQTEVQKI